MKSRYNGNWFDMWRACFSGIPWGAITVVTTVSIVIVSLSFRKDVFKMNYIVAVLFGAAIVPFVFQYVFVPTKSKVFTSTILEEKETCPGKILAWFYYFSYLEKELPIFSSTFLKTISIQETPMLSLDRLILLISIDCTTTDDLEQLDSKIHRVTEICTGKFTFPVYELAYKDKQYKYVIKCAMQPLKILHQMSYLKSVTAMHPSELNKKFGFFTKHYLIF